MVIMPMKRRFGPLATWSALLLGLAALIGTNLPAEGTDGMTYLSLTVWGWW